MEVIMDEDRLTPYWVVQFFQRNLNDAGNPIVFTEEGELDIQLAHASRLIAACKCSRREIKAVIRVYCVDEWWVKNQPSLHQVVKQLDKLRARIKGREAYPTSWEEL